MILTFSSSVLSFLPLFILFVIIVGYLLWLLQVPSLPSSYLPSNSSITLKQAKEKWKQSIKEFKKTNENYLVIGAGFLGSRIIESLLERGENVTIFDFSSSNCWVNDKRVKYIQGDITKLNEVNEACKNIQTVFLTAAVINFMDNLPHQYEASYRVNVTGTENVIKACQNNNVKYLIQTSTLHVSVQNPYHNTNSIWSLFQIPKKTIIYLNENDPYVTKDTATSHYGSTKAIAEQLVLQANSSTLSTISIRPPGIFGANDRYVAEDMLVNSEYYFIDFTMLIDWEYVDNVCYAHLLAEYKLRTTINKPNDLISGNSFLLSSGEPLYNNTFRSMIIYYGKLKAKVAPPRLIWLFGYIIEILQRIFKKSFPVLPFPLIYLTLTALRIMDLDLVIKSNKAKDILGYKDVFTVEEGIQLTVIEYNHKKNGKNITLFTNE